MSSNTKVGSSRSVTFMNSWLRIPQAPTNLTKLTTQMITGGRTCGTSTTGTVTKGSGSEWIRTYSHRKTGQIYFYVQTLSEDPKTKKIKTIRQWYTVGRSDPMAKQRGKSGKDLRLTEDDKEILALTASNDVSVGAL